MVQICRPENIEYKSMKQVSYSGKYFLSASRAHHSFLQFSFIFEDAFCQSHIEKQVVVLWQFIINPLYRALVAVVLLKIHIIRGLFTK